mgnify:CR=1 FL=1
MSSLMEILLECNNRLKLNDVFVPQQISFDRKPDIRGSVQ